VSILRLVFKELLFSKLTSLLMLLAVSTAAAYAVATVTTLRLRQDALQQRVAAMDDEIRKITKDMGFNINILPREQNLTDFYAQDFAEKTMPYDWVQKLADSEIATIQHLRPALIRKVQWPEQNRQVILMGVHAVVPWTHRKSPQPLADPVPPGTLVLGHQLSRELGLAVGSPVKLLERDFTVGKVLPARGDKDDVTVFLDLAAAQEMLALPDRINLIQALECNCATIDRLGEIEAEIATVLGGDVQLIELSTKAIARARARTETEQSGKRHLQEAQQQGLVYTLLAIVTACILTASLFVLNARQRLGEVAIWRALGLSRPRIMLLFLGKAVALGVVGGILGYSVGMNLSSLGGPLPVSPSESTLAVQDAAQGLVPVVLIVTPLLTVLSSWVPAMFAAYRQPALVLARE